MTEPISSIQPLIIILLPIVAGILNALLGYTKIKYIRESLTITVLVCELVLALSMGIRVIHGEVLVSLGQALRVGGLSALMIILISPMVLLIAIYSARYMRHEQETGLITEGRLGLYYALILIFTGTMMWTVTTNNLLMLYVAMEGTTITSALLVAFYHRKPSLEAGYKYVLLVVVGITFSLFGITLVFASAVPHLPEGAQALMLTEVGKIAKLIPKNIALLSVAFMTVGFATKAGLVPFHAWLPDAHAEAPSPTGALLSGLIIKIGAYALARTVTIFAPTYHSIIVFIAILSSASMLIGIFMALVQDDIKRLLAYSSVSQISYVFEGLGLGTYLGIYGGLFHMLNHTVIKGLLFLCAGAIMYATNGERKISRLGGLSKKMPITAFCFFVGALSLGGLPPFNGFMSKFTIFVAIGEQRLYWAAAISILTGLLTLGCLVWAAYRIFWQSPKEPIVVGNPGEVKEVPAIMWLAMIFLALVCIIIGIFPQITYPLLNSATNAILDIWAQGK